MSVNIFFCYAREDERLLNELQKHLRPLQRGGLISFWYDRNINPGADWKKEINEHLNTAQIILLLMSPDFMKSDYCYGIEMKRALERHNRGDARVIPIILRPTHWRGVLGSLQALPSDGIPITDPRSHTLDQALHDVTEEISQIAYQLQEENQRTRVKQKEKVRNGPSPNPSTTTLKFNHFAAPGSTQTLSHKPQIIKYQDEESEDEQWMELRWFILASSVLSLFFSIFIFFLQNTTIIGFAAFSLLACIILGLIQAAHLNQWRWFASLLIFGPLAGLIYAWLHPTTKGTQSLPSRQLIMIILWLGFILLGVFLILQSQSTDILSKVHLGIFCDLLFAGTLLTVIRASKLKHLSIEESSDLFSLFVFFWAAPLIALIYIMSPNSKKDNTKAQ